MHLLRVEAAISFEFVAEKIARWQQCSDNKAMIEVDGGGSGDGGGVVAMQR